MWRCGSVISAASLVTNGTNEPPRASEMPLRRWDWAHASGSRERLHEDDAKLKVAVASYSKTCRSAATMTGPANFERIIRTPSSFAPR